jgi:hypothetical protein
MLTLCVPQRIAVSRRSIVAVKSLEQRRIKVVGGLGPIELDEQKRLSYYLPRSLCHPPILIRFASL